MERQTFLDALPYLFSSVTGAKRTLNDSDLQYMWQILQKIDPPIDDDKITFDQFYEVNCR